METAKLIQCPSCKKNFTAKDSSRSQQHVHFPYIVKCGHTVCESCIRSAIKCKQKFTCLLCQTDTELPEGEDFTQVLVPDIHILGLLTFKVQRKSNVNLKLISLGATAGNDEIHDANALLCDECNKVAAVWRCDKCAVNFCNSCFDSIHRRSKVMMKHESHPIQAEAYHSLVQGGCSEHLQRQIEFFCETDQQLVCSHCVVMGQHKGHDVVTLMDKNESYIDELKVTMEEGHKIQQRFRFTEKKLQEAIPSSKIDVSLLVGEVKKHFHKIHSTLQLREAELISELQNVSNHNISSLQSLCDRLSHYRKVMAANLKDAEELLSNRYISVSAIELLKKLKGLKDVPCYLISAPTSESPDINVVFDQDLVEKFKTYGTISTDKTSKYILKTEKELPPDFQMDMEEESVTDTESVNSPSVLSDLQSDDILTSPVTNTVLAKEKNAFLKASMGSLKEEVFVSHISSPSNFWVQKYSDKRKLETLQDLMNRWCGKTNSEKNAAKSAQVGGLYLVKYSVDGVWYRARLRKIIKRESGDSESTDVVLLDQCDVKEDLVDVIYVDFGNSEIIPVSRLKMIPPRYLHQPGFAINCSLWDIVPAHQEKWSQEAIKVFAKFVGDRTVIMKVMNQVNDLLYVDLSHPPSNGIANDTPVSVRDALVFLDYGLLVAENQKKSGFKYHNKRKYLPAEQLCPDVVVNVILSHVDSPDSFYVQKLGGGARYLSNLQFQLQEKYTNEPDHLHVIYTPTPGMVCVSQYSRDKQWYRAEVTSIKNSNMVGVQYIDYGNAEFVPYWRLRKIPDAFLKLNKQAICCCLADVTPTNDDGWGEEVNKWFTEVAGKEQLHVRTKSIIPGQKKASVVVYQTKSNVDTCVNTMIVKRGFALSTGPESKILEIQHETYPRPRTIPNVLFRKQNEINSKVQHDQPTAAVTTAPKKDTNKALPYIPVHVLYAESPSSVCVRLATDEEQKKFEKFKSDMQEVYQQTSISEVEWKNMDICAMLSSDDSCWYRGRIVKEVDSKHFRVVKIDFGSSEVVHSNDLRILLESFQKENVFCIKCKLTGIVPAGADNQWTFMACEFLQELVSKNELFFMANKGENENGLQPVDLLYEEVQGGALEPSVLQYRSIANLLMDKGLALPMRRLSQEMNNNLDKADEPKPSSSSKECTDVPQTQIHDVNKETEKRKEIPNNEMQGREDKKCLWPQNEALYWKPPTLPEDEHFLVVPTHVGHDGCIYLTLSSSKSILNLIRNALQEMYSSPEWTAPDAAPEVGQACIAQFCLDNKWYRAQVVSKKADQIKVLFIDYGNHEIVSLDNIRTNLILTEIPQQCLESELFDLLPITEDGEWSIPVLDFIHNTIVEQTCSITLEEPPHPGKRIQISLKLPDETNLASLLIESGYAISASSLLLPKKEMDDTIQDTNSVNLQEKNIFNKNTSDQVSSVSMPKPLLEETIPSEIQSFAKYTLPKAGYQFPIIITQLLEPNLVYIQQLLFTDTTIPGAEERNEEFHQFVAMIELLSESAEEFELVKDPKPGMACCGRYTYDNKWYRCQITTINSDDSVSVLYVDYGNSETVSPDRLRCLPDKFLDFPVQAHLCKLCGIEPAGDVWLEEESEEIITELLKKNHSYTATVKEFGKPLQVDLFIDGSFSEDGSPQHIAQAINKQKTAEDTL